MFKVTWKLKVIDNDASYSMGVGCSGHAFSLYNVTYDIFSSIGSLVVVNHCWIASNAYREGDIVALTNFSFNLMRYDQ